MNPLTIILTIMAIFYIFYLLGRLRLMTMPITVSEEGTKIVAMIDRSLRKYDLEVSCICCSYGVEIYNPIFYRDINRIETE